MSAVISLFEARERVRGARQTGPAVDGSVRAVIEPSDGRSAIKDLYQHEPLRLLCPRADDREPLTGILLNTAGGLVGGDRHRIQIDCLANSHALITGQSAEKIYRSAGPTSVVEVALKAGRDAVLEWLPQGTILFDHARLRRQTTIRREAGSRVLAGEILVLGRLGMGETFCTGMLFDQWRIEDGGNLAWIDALRLDDDLDRMRRSPAGLGDATALATAVFIADDASDLLDDARALIAETAPSLSAGATTFGPVLLCRWLSNEPHRLRQAFGAFWSAFRARALGRPESLPVLWQR